VKSAEVGFASATFVNDSRMTIDSLRVKVSFSSQSGEEVVESAEFFVSLPADGRKHVDLGLGRIRELTAKAKASRQHPAWVILIVDSVTFTDGSQWNASDPVVYDPR
jgi:hypothetical protein